MTSQSNEDDIISDLLERVPPVGKRFVDIGAKHVANSNVARLVIEEGWSGALIDRGAKSVQALRSGWRELHLQTAWRCHLGPERGLDCVICERFELSPRGAPLTVVHNTVSPENVNEMVGEEVDLLSIDIDGQDYYVWEALNARPRLVAIEFNPRRQGDSVMRLDPSYEWKREKNYGAYGASRAAMVRLGLSKRYRLVAENENNLFFADLALLAGS